MDVIRNLGGLLLGCPDGIKLVCRLLLAGLGQLQLGKEHLDALILRVTHHAACEFVLILLPVQVQGLQLGQQRIDLLLGYVGIHGHNGLGDVVEFLHSAVSGGGGHDQAAAYKA